MPITLDGTAGITNDATDLNYTGTLTGGTGVINIGSGQLYKDASGNVGIGTSSPSTRLDVAGSVRTSSTYLLGTATDGSTGQFAISGGDMFFDYPGALRFRSGASAERMRITSGGNVGIGTTTPGVLLSVRGSSTGDNDGVFQPFNTNTAAAACVASFVTGTNSTATSNVLIKFGIDNYAQGQGQINANGANAAAFGSFSDSRLKENIVNLPSQLENICALRPVEFDYIESEGGGHQTGFIAQEMQEVYPDAVGERGDGMLTVTGWDKTTARLVAAIQEQQAIIEQLKADVAALKGAQA
jgi:hypothetical protein